MDNILGLFFDILILSIITLSAFLGWRRGIFASLVRLVRILLCVVLAGFASSPVADLISEHSSIDEGIVSHISAGIDNTFADTVLMGSMPESVQTILLSGGQEFSFILAQKAGHIMLKIIAFLIILFLLRIISDIIINLNIFSGRSNPIGCINGLFGFCLGTIRGYVFVSILLVLLIPIVALLGPDLSVNFLNGFNSSYIGAALFSHNPILMLLDYLS